MLSMVYADFLNILAFDTLDIRLLCDKGVKIGNQSSGGAAMAIRKRTWQAADGTERTAWVVDYKDAAGKRRLKTFKRQKDAARYRDEIAPQLRAGIHTPDSISKTIAEAAAAWLAHCEAEKLERSTIRQRQQHINLHINPFIGAVKLSQLTAPKVRTFIDDLRDAGRSVAMRQKVLTNVKTMLSYAQERGLVAQNVARGVKIKRDKRDNARAMDEGSAMPTKAELRSMIKTLNGWFRHAESRAMLADVQSHIGLPPPPPEPNRWRWRPLFITAIFTGMRASELRGLAWNHVDLDRQVIQVRQRADAWGTIAAPKSAAGVRDIPLAPMVVNTLKEWKLACPKGDLNLVFPNGRGNVESHSNIFRRGFAPLQLQCGITEPTDKKNNRGHPIMKPKYSLHTLRHAAASLFIEQGWTPKRVQTVMGHASIAMTYDLYGKLFKDEEDDKRSMELLQARLLG